METKKLEETIIRGGKCLIISLLIDPYYNKEALKKTMGKILRSIKSISFRNWGAKMILVEFEGCRDKDRIHLERPWSFDKNLILMKELEDDL